MKFKRLLFILILIVIFIVCFMKVNEQYDEFSRYQYTLTQEEKDIILKYFNNEEINEMIDSQLEPKDFLPFIEVDGFELKNTLWYSEALKYQEEDKTYIVSFINKYRSKLSFDDLQLLLTNYKYQFLSMYLSQGDLYGNASLVLNPRDKYLCMDEKHTLYRYIPDDLVALDDIECASVYQQDTLYLKKEAYNALKALLKASKEISELEQGDLLVDMAYLSYEEQVLVYNHETITFDDLPGRSEYQLGYSVHLTSKKLDFDEDSELSQEEIDETNQHLVNAQITWLKDNAYKYGFIIRFDEGFEEITHHKYDPFLLRYVGVDEALQMQKDNVALEQTNFNAKSK